MKLNNKEKLTIFLRDQLSNMDLRMQSYVFDQGGEAYPKRDLFQKLKDIIDDFLTVKSSDRIILLTGLRGAGKTTLTAQIYYSLKSIDAYRLYLSTDQIVQILNVSLDDALSAFEELIGMSFEKLDKPLILFLDEVQYEKKWGPILKSIYDRSKKVFVFATGSSALSLNSTGDLSRRAIPCKLYPLSFTEYIKTKLRKDKIEGLGDRLRKSIFEAANAQEVYDKLLDIQLDINKYWLMVDRMEVEKYIKYGSLPFMISTTNEAIIYDQIKKGVDRIINDDIVYLNQFSSEIIVKIPSIVYMIAGADMVSATKLASETGISRPKIIEILDVLEKTELLFRVLPYSSNFSQINKPSKYLFAAPAVRSMYFNYIGSIDMGINSMGKLWEDTVGMYLMRVLSEQLNTSLNYDSQKGGADFIVSVNKERIIIEVSKGSKGYDQVEQTSQKIKAKYGIVISPDPLRISDSKTMVKIPMEYFLLVL